EIKKQVISAMEILQYLSNHIPFKEDNEQIWLNIVNKYEQILEIKDNANNLIIQQAISEAFQDFQTFIDDGVYAYMIKRGKIGTTIENWMQLTYGFNAEQMESKKIENRKVVVEYLADFANQIRSGKPLTLEMLTKLHEVNNKGIVPK